jgi:hypothetical protein
MRLGNSGQIISVLTGGFSLPGDVVESEDEKKKK